MKIKTELYKNLKQMGIREIECQVPDIAGNPRGKIIPLRQFLNDDVRMAELIFTQGISGGWCGVDSEVMNAQEKDMTLRMDEETLRQHPYATRPTMLAIHDCFMNNHLHEIAPRNVLKRVLQSYSDRGWTPVVAPELEFYIVAKNENPSKELQPPKGKSGRPDTTGHTLNLFSAREFSDFLTDLTNKAEAMQIDVDIFVHEDGPGQLEVNLLHGNALSLADQVFIFKQLAKHVAFEHNMHATFMAKPYGNSAGSAMHIHQSVIESSSGRNIFSDPNGNETELFSYFIAGLQKYTKNIMSIYAPYVNSYKRFSKLFPSSPTNLNWGYDNRTVALRVPNSGPDAKRIENRFPGMDCNPYLAIAGSLASGYLGIENKIQVSKPIAEDNMLEEEITIPRSLNASLDLLEEEHKIVDLLGRKFIKTYKAVKWQEFEDHNTHISTWEREHLLLAT